jgi:polysaccharide pyruvyl transferase WcaK-like protein
MRQTAFFVRTNIQFENLGDLLINRELVKIASRHGHVFIHKGNSPEYFIRTIALEAGTVFIKSTWDFFARMVSERLKNRNCIYFLCPGGLCGRVTLYQFFLKISTLPIIYLLRMFGVRVVHLGVSVSAIEPLMAVYLRMRAPGMFAFYVRDIYSAEQLATAGVPTDGVLPDLAFNIFEAETIKSKRIQNIVISFRTDQDTFQAENVMRFVDKLVTWLPETCKITILAQVRFDIDGMRILYERLTARGISVELLVSCEDIDKNVRIMRHCDVVFSNRLHVLLLGGIQGSRMVACVDDSEQKIRGLFSTIGLDAAVLNLNLNPTSSMVEAAMAVQYSGEVEAARLREGFESLIAT